MFEREDNTERFYVSGDPGADDVVRYGFRWLLGYATDNGHDRAAIVLPGVRNAQYLDRILGAAAAKSLQKDRRLQIGALTVEMYTEAKPPGGFDGPVLAVWTRDKSLDKLDTTGAAAICAAPWVPDNIEDWKTNWNPVDVRTGTAVGADSTVSNPVVAKGLEHLTSRVNLSTGLAHPSDRSAAIELFRLFVRGGEGFDPDQVRAWAVRHGWRPDDARDLADVAHKIQEGRKLKAAPGGGWREDYLDRLREEAAGER